MSYEREYDSGSCRRFRGPPGPVPVEVGKEYEVEVSEISKQGDGVARIQGFVILVKSGKTGQKVKIRIDQVADRFAKATIVD
jgi:predicted RNA-binding protein with TRAM domain